jgi:hypothetical protein
MGRRDDKRSWPNLRYHSPRGTEKNHEKPQSGQPDFGPKNVEPGTSRKRSRGVNHSTTTFGVGDEECGRTGTSEHIKLSTS